MAAFSGSAPLRMLRPGWHHGLCCPSHHPGPSLSPFDAWPKHKVLTRWFGFCWFVVFFSLGPPFVDLGGVLPINGSSIEPSESYSWAEGLHHLSLPPLAPSPPYGGHHPALLELS